MDVWSLPKTQKRQFPTHAAVSIPIWPKRMALLPNLLRETASAVAISIDASRCSCRRKS